jgi:hypothetical protein
MGLGETVWRSLQSLYKIDDDGAMLETFDEIKAAHMRCRSGAANAIVH